MRTIGRHIPLGRVGEPAEVARCALFLASDDASDVTAANLLIDGGWSAVLPGGLPADRTKTRHRGRVDYGHATQPQI
jgi:NAD(P)-dependent dehydrogenase (short-subunit alcohol dehydrogenase family)